MRDERTHFQHRRHRRCCPIRQSRHCSARSWSQSCWPRAARADQAPARARSGSGLETGGYKSPLTESLTGGKKGGTLQVLQETEFEHLDPGEAYYNIDYPVVFATQRPLYSYKPNQSEENTPDLASGRRKSPLTARPSRSTSRKASTSARPSTAKSRRPTSPTGSSAGANPTVANGYTQAYFASIEGMPKAKGGPVKGIETPDKHTIVFHLTEPKGQIVAAALVLPLSAPVPKEYAEKYDKHEPSDYANYQVGDGSVHDQEQQRRQGPRGRLLPRQVADAWCATRTGRRAPTTGRPT